MSVDSVRASAFCDRSGRITQPLRRQTGSAGISPFSRLAGFIVTRSRLIIAIVGTCNLAALLSITRIALNTDITSFFGEDNEVYSEYLALMERYGISDSLTIRIEDSNSLLTEESLLTVYDLRAEVETISGVAEVQTFLPERMPMGGHVLVVDERFISVHSDVLGDYTWDRYAPATGLLAKHEGTGLITLTLKSGTDAALPR